MGGQWFLEEVVVSARQTDLDPGVGGQAAGVIGEVYLQFVLGWDSG